MCTFIRKIFINSRSIMVELDLSNRRMPNVPIDLWKPCLLLYFTGKGSSGYADFADLERQACNSPFLSMAESHGLVM